MWEYLKKTYISEVCVMSQNANDVELLFAEWFLSIYHSK